MRKANSYKFYKSKILYKNVLLDSKTEFVRERIWRKLVTIILTIKFNTSKHEQAKS
jgi:hypothetical protein